MGSNAASAVEIQALVAEVSSDALAKDRLAALAASLIEQAVSGARVGRHHLAISWTVS
jgi:hypothetical protein